MHDSHPNLPHLAFFAPSSLESPLTCPVNGAAHWAELVQPIFPRGHQNRQRLGGRRGVWPEWEGAQRSASGLGQAEEQVGGIFLSRMLLMMWQPVLARRMEGRAHRRSFLAPQHQLPLPEEVAHVGRSGPPPSDSPCPGNHEALCPASKAGSPGLFGPSTGP